MYAVVDIAGQQIKVAKDDKVYVNRLDAAEGAKVDFDRVLMVDDNGKVAVGAPVVEGASVKATVITHLKDKKITVFKKKRRKGYQKSNGHRQSLTQIKIENISLKGGKAKTAKADSAEAPTEG
jgi:large subunit ribosomal protein L21